ncbi:MAG: hypothetical protein EB072_18195, partial [Betaproteobacteria bacterium]|nr:hypothetical protein [Betaproteobacteria bacterium]
YFNTPSAGSALAAWAINGGGQLGMNFSGNAVVQLGSLSGTSGWIHGGNTKTGTKTIEVGALGTSTTYAGRFLDYDAVNSGSQIALRKIGAGTLTLSAASTHSGATEVLSGVLNVTGSLGRIQGRGGRVATIGQRPGIRSLIRPVGDLDACQRSLGKRAISGGRWRHGRRYGAREPDAGARRQSDQRDSIPETGYIRPLRQRPVRAHPEPAKRDDRLGRRGERDERNASTASVLSTGRAVVQRWRNEFADHEQQCRTHLRGLDGRGLLDDRGHTRRRWSVHYRRPQRLSRPGLHVPGRVLNRLCGRVHERTRQQPRLLANNTRPEDRRVRGLDRRRHGRRLLAAVPRGGHPECQPRHRLRQRRCHQPCCGRPDRDVGPGPSRCGAGARPRSTRGGADRSDRPVHVGVGQHHGDTLGVEQHPSVCRRSRNTDALPRREHEPHLGCCHRGAAHERLRCGPHARLRIAHVDRSRRWACDQRQCGVHRGHARPRCGLKQRR